MKALVILALLAGAAQADPMNTISVLPRGFAGDGLAIEGERDLPAQRISAALALSARSSAGGDYDSLTLGLGGEARYWFRRHRGLARGWYAALRLDLDRTSLSMAGASLGSMRTISFGVRGGYRWVPWRGLEVRPFVGIAVRRDSSPAWWRGGLDYGLALGWSF